MFQEERKRNPTLYFSERNKTILLSNSQLSIFEGQCDFIGSFTNYFSGTSFTIYFLDALQKTLQQTITRSTWSQRTGRDDVQKRTNSTTFRKEVEFQKAQRNWDGMKKNMKGRHPYSHLCKVWTECLRTWVFSSKFLQQNKMGPFYTTHKNPSSTKASGEEILHRKIRIHN